MTLQTSDNTQDGSAKEQPHRELAPQTPKDTPTKLDENQYGVANWLIKAMKTYDGMMSHEKALTKGYKMKAKRQLQQAINEYFEGAIPEKMSLKVPHHGPDPKTVYYKRGFNKCIDDIRKRMEL